MSEQEGTTPEEAAALELQTRLVKAFVGGVEAASIAMRGILARKAQVGIISEETAKSIFEAVGVELAEAFGEER